MSRLLIALLGLCFLQGCPKTKVCDAYNCGGCCDATGACLDGRDSSACGANGAACVACDTADSCGNGSCGGSWKCSTATGGAETPLVWVPEGTRITGIAGSPNFQHITFTATLPNACYASVRMVFKALATCSGSAPMGQNWPSLCDPFDRIAFLAQHDGTGTRMVLLDGTTAFGTDTTFEQDLTDYQTALAGTHTYELFLTTAASPDGLATGTQAGWDVGVTLFTTPGRPPRQVVGVAPVFQGSYYATTTSFTGPMTVPLEATKARLDLFTTGHSQSNKSCDEFCQKLHHVSVDGTELNAFTPWLDCAPFCTATATGDSCGTRCVENLHTCATNAKAARAGWCPSRATERRAFNFAITPGKTSQVELRIDSVVSFFNAAATAVFYR